MDPLSSPLSLALLSAKWRESSTLIQRACTHFQFLALLAATARRWTGEENTFLFLVQ
jgi:hypothetical protein